MDARVARIDKKTLEDALRDHPGRSLAFDASIKPIREIIDRVDKQVARPNPGAVPRRDFVAARLRYYALRAMTPRRSSTSPLPVFTISRFARAISPPERHHNRSQMFFYGMLVAQMGVIIATLAMAARKRNLLWSLAAGAAPLPSRSPSTSICACRAAARPAAIPGKRGPLPAFAGAHVLEKEPVRAILPVAK